LLDKSPEYAGKVVDIRFSILSEMSAAGLEVVKPMDRRVG
jgi:hypothetical protein